MLLIDTLYACAIEIPAQNTSTAVKMLISISNKYAFKFSTGTEV